ncbi:mycofactocin system transcriptional regulator [Dactylosporangium sp. NPDC051484]|uniref:mycofactocin system transcriptional regulator n=1 Tax=Dactylosporangium sp. NPDC051484 TaxID=3154942 RepID=UPI00344C4241
MAETSSPDVRRSGRKPSTSRGELERLALELFATRGFDETAVDDIAAAAGIGRRTFFRYYPSKNDVVWGDFDRELDRMREWLNTSHDELPFMDAIRGAVIAFNTYDPATLASHRHRMSLILTVPALQAHSTLRYAEWRAVIAEFAARRLGQRPGDFLPCVIGYAALGAAIASYEQWLLDAHTPLGALLDTAFRELAAGFCGHEGP